MKLIVTTFPFLRVLACALALSACASPPQTNTPELIGTWRWVSVEGRRVDLPFYIRYYPNGKAATWPAPKGWSDSKGVSRGRYLITNGYLVLDTSYADDPKARIRIQKDQLTLTNDEGYRLVYRRVLPTLEPGRLADGTPAGFARH